MLMFQNIFQGNTLFNAYARTLTSIFMFFFFVLFTAQMAQAFY